MLDRQASTTPVVDVDVWASGAWRSSADDNRDAVAAQALWERVGSMEGDEQHAVPVAGGQVALDTLLIRARLRHEEHQLHLVGVERLADAAQHPREERVAEEPCRWLGDDDGDRIAAPCHEAAGRAVWHVSQLLDRRLDSRAGRAPNAPIAVDDPGGSGTRDARCFGNVLQRRATARGAHQDRRHSRESALATIRAW